MSGFLAHASDARDFLMRMILHQRDNLEDIARAQRRPAEALWNEAVGKLNDPAADGSRSDSRTSLVVVDPPRVVAGGS